MGVSEETRLDFYKRNPKVPDITMSSTNATSSTDGPELGCEEAVANSRKIPKAGVTEARVLRRTPRRLMTQRRVLIPGVDVGR